MTRKTKLLLNSTSSLMYQFVTLICGFILPRFFLASYGSAVNGLVSSITQFLGFISLAECGVGAVVQSTLYKPLADKDMLTVSKIVASSDRFFKRIAYLLLVYVAVLMVVYPLINLEQFDYIFTLILIFVISISTFAQYYLGMTYKLLLNADQLGFIQYTIHAIALIINTVCCIVLMKNDVSVHIVKLTTSVIFLLQPLLLSFIAKRKYNLEYRIKLTEEPIKQKWNGMAQHVATVVLGNTDTVVLTLLSTLENVSIYGVYHLIVNGVKQIVLSTTNGMQAMLGNMIAKNEIEKLNNTFDYIEWILHSLVTFAFSVAAILIIPFVQVYTADITDANYIVPVFAYLITLAQASYCIRLPYNIMVLAAGHYKQTQSSAIVEAVLNVVISVILVFKFGLIGVAIGTFVAMVYRTIYLATYLMKNIIFRKISYFVKHICVDVCGVCLLLFVVYIFPDFFSLQALNYAAWILLAVKVALTGFVILLLINIIFYKSMLIRFFQLKLKNNLMESNEMNKLFNQDLERYAAKRAVPRFQKYLRKCQTIKNKILKLFYKVIYYKLARKNHIEIPVSTQIGGGLYIGHPFCITINPRTVIGYNCNIHKGVTIGQENRGIREGAPVIGNSVWIGVNSTIVGKINIGNDVLIAPNSYVNCDVPDHSVVFGNPCIIKHKENATEGYINRKCDV